MTDRESNKARIIRYGKRTLESEQFAPAELPETEMVAITKHVEAYFGTAPSVFHEVLSQGIHLDVLLLNATREHPFRTFATMGMSAAPMTVPEGVRAPTHLELLVHVSADWPMDSASWSDENHYWPVRWLKHLAHLPQDYATFLDVGHTIPNGNPPRRFTLKCPFVCWMLLRPSVLAAEFMNLQVGGKSIRFLQIVPLFQEEMEYKLKHGVEALLERFDNASLNRVELTDPGRRNCCAVEK